MTRQSLSLDDGTLVLRCQRGDTKAFELLVARHTRLAGAIAMSVVCDYHVAKDVVQDAFVKVLSRLDALEDPSRFRGWLRNIVRTTAIDSLRRRKVAGRSAAALPGQEEGSSPLPSQDRPPEELLAQSELREQVRAEIAQLPDSQREVVMLKYIEGLSYEEIAEVSGLTVGTIESRLFRARASLRKQLQARLGLEDSGSKGRKRDD